MEYPKVEQPPNFKINLFPHQLTSIYNMEKLERERHTYIDENYRVDTNMGFLGDIPGFGKSYSVLGLVQRDRMTWNLNEEFIQSYYHTHNYFYRTVTMSKKNRIRPNLILVSNSVFDQWKEYVSNTELKAYFINSRSSLQKLIPLAHVYIPENERPLHVHNINDYDIVVVTQTFYNDLITYYENYVWKRFIYDDPTTVFVSKMKVLHCGFMWFVTATPTWFLSWELRGRKAHFLKMIMDYIDSNILFSLTIKNPDEYIKQSFSIPSTIKHVYKCKSPAILKVLNNFISDEVRVMISAGNIGGALRNLGGTTTSSLIEVVGKRKKNNIRQSQLKIQYYQSLQEQTGENQDEEINKWKAELEKSEKEYKELQERYKEFLSEECVICAESLNAPILTPCCQNITCGKCILEWVSKKKTCLICRKPIEPSDLKLITKDLDGNEIYKEDEIINMGEKLKEKPDEMMNIIKKIKQGNANAKIILFSDYSETYELIKNMFKGTKYVCKDIQGTTARRTKIIKEFKEGKTDIIFLNSKNNGSGINLQETTDIIIYHSMSPEVTEQIVGRAMRIGRRENLHIHEFQEI